MNTALMVDTLHQKGCKFLLTRNFKDLDKTQEAVQVHHKAVAEGKQRKIIVMAIQHDVLPDYTILVTTTYPNEREIEQFGFYPVKKDRANWIPIQYRNSESSSSFDHTTNFNFLPIEEVHEYLKMAEKKAQIKLIYK